VAWPSDLGSLQRRFLALVTAPGGVNNALEAMNSTPDDLAGLVVTDDKLDQVGRVGIYADMYLERLIDVVRDDFRKLSAVLGEEAFADLVRDFLAAVPPDGFSLRDLGGPLPAYLAGHALSAARPWLPDLARLEWSRADLFDLPDCDTLAFDQLRGLAPERFAELELALVPAHRQCTVAFAVDDLWRQLERGQPPTPVGPAPGHLLVWRQRGDVLHRRSDAVEAELLPLLGEGTTFGLVCERLGRGRSVEEAAGLAFPLLSRWSAEGLLRLPDGLK
jgi:hypothetical protein